MIHTVTGKVLRESLKPLAFAAKTPFDIELVTIMATSESLAFFASTQLVTASASCPADGQGEWVTTVDYAKLVKVIEKTDGDITFSFKKSLTVKGSSFTATFQPREHHFMDATFTQGDLVIATPAHVLKRALNEVIHAAADNHDGRENLKGVNVVTGHPMRFYASDGFRAARSSLVHAQPPLESTDRSWILPTDSAKDLIKILGKSEESVTISGSENTVSVAFPWGTWQSSTIGLTYPNVQQIIEGWSNEEELASMVVDRQEFINSLKSCAAFDTLKGSDRYSRVRVATNGECLVVSAKNESGDVEVSLHGVIQGAFSFIADAAYLLQAASAYTSDEIVLYHAPRGGILIDSPESDGVQVVVPITLAES